MSLPRTSDPVLYRASDPARSKEGPLRLFSGIAFLAAAGVIATASLTSSFESWRTLVLLSALVICAEHRDRLFGDQTSASGSIVVAMAAVCAFSRGPWLAGPMACAAFAGAYWPHIRNGAWSRVAVNASSMSLAAATAAAVFHILGAGPNELGVRSLLGGAVAVVAFWFVNSLVLGIAVSMIQPRRLREVVIGLVRSETELLVFAYGGFLIGFAFANEPIWLAALALVGLLGGLDLLLVSRSSRASELLTWTLPGVEAVTVVAALVWFGTDEAGLSGVALTVACVIVLASLAGKRRSERYFRFAALSAAIAVLASPAFHESFFAPVAVALLAYLVPIWRRTSLCNRLSVFAATGFAAISVVLAIGVMPSRLLSTVSGSVLVGAVGGVTALAVWHVFLGTTLMLRAGRGSGSAALGVLIGDLPFSIAGGAFGAACGWIGAQVGAAGLAGSLAIGLALVWVADRWSGATQRSPLTRLDDEDLGDVVRSALLDLPASRLPD